MRLSLLGDQAPDCLCGFDLFAFGIQFPVCTRARYGDLAPPWQRVFKALHDEKHQLHVGSGQNAFHGPLDAGAVCPIAIAQDVLHFSLGDLDVRSGGSEGDAEDPDAGVGVLDGLGNKRDLGAVTLTGHGQ